MTSIAFVEVRRKINQGHESKKGIIREMEGEEKRGRIRKNYRVNMIKVHNICIYTNVM
jgi:hypothetical protein